MRTFVIRIVRNLLGFIARGNRFRREIPERVHHASVRDWNASEIEAIRRDLVPHFQDASRYLLWFSVFFFVPLCVVVAAVSRFENFAGPLQTTFVWLAVGIVVFGIWPFMHMVPLVRAIRRIPQKRNATVYRDLIGIFWFNADVFCISLNVGLLLYTLMSWRLSVASPLVIALSIAWLVAPWAAYIAKLDLLYVYVRLGQTVLLFILAIVVIASPVPVAHYQWWAQREGEKHLSPIVQKEITSEWSSLRWFSQTGIPNVWFSGDSKRGYRLFDAPGNDPQTNEKLQAVADLRTKENIVEWLAEKKRNDDRKAEIAKEQRAAEAAAQKQRDDEKRIADQATAEKLRQQQISETKETLIREYVLSHATAKREKAAVVVIALNNDGEEDSGLTEEFSNLLSNSGLPNSRSIFSPAFIKSEAFKGILAGGPKPDSLFDASTFASKALIIRISNAPAASTSVGGTELAVVDIVCAVRLIVLADARVERSSEFKERGIGFNRTAASEVALDRVEKKFIAFASTLRTQTSSDQ